MAVASGQPSTIGRRHAAVRVPARVRYFPLMLLGGAALVLVLLVAHVSIGTADISLQSVLDTLLGRQVDSVTYTIIHELRLPRALVAAVAGAMLGLAGALMQAVTRNPLADPDLTGAATGGVLFAVLWLSRDMIGWNVAPPNVTIPAVAMVGSVLTGGIVYGLSRARGGHTNTVRLVLAGVMVSAIMRSMTSLVLLVNQNAVSGILLWIIGSLNGRTWTHWDTVWPWAIVTIPVALACASLANALHLGDDIATGLGLRSEWTRGFLLFVAVLLTAGAVSVVGALGFLGLIAPHLTRRLVGNDARRLFPLSALMGASLLILADILARGLTRVVDLPVGAVMAIVGAPFLMYLLRRETKR
jgi:iron complex transport system permease protein